MRSPSCFKPGSTLAAASVLALLVLPACPNRQVAEVDPDTVGQGGKTVSVNVNRNVDILFVIDNSSSMAEEQQSLADNFDKFIEVLSSVDGGLPSVHIGVISTDMGAEEPGGFTTVECKGTGDEGRLQAAPQVGGCTPPSDSYISDIKDEDTGDRTINYPKDQLAETFSCIARLGTGGCVFEQTLESMRAALDPDMNLNPGFLRDDAYLGIVFITDEDDCSASDPHIFNGDPDLSNKDSDVGFYASYRCFEFGVQCDPTVGRDPASYTNCTPRTDSDYLYNVQTRYVDFLKGLKTDSNQIILAAITGKTTNGAVEVMDRFRDQQPADGNDDTLGDVELAPSCSSGTGSAVPPVRIKYLLDQFPDSQTHLAEICQADLSGPIRDIAEVFAAKIGNTCLPGDLVDTDPAAGGIQPQCVVTETVGGEDTQFPLCDADNSNTPCYRVEMSAECDPADYPTQLQVVIERGGTTPPASASLNLTCAVNG